MLDVVMRGYRRWRFSLIHGWLLSGALLLGCGDRAGDADAATQDAATDDAAMDGAAADASPSDGTVGDGEVGQDSGTDAVTPCVDTDGDGYGTGCMAGPDCDDSTALVRPGRDEIPWNGVDDDCDPTTPDSQVFDLGQIADAVTAQCTFTSPRQVVDGLTLMDLWDVSYWSWESIDGELAPILIRGYAAKPADQDTDLPGVVQAHGLGGYAREDNATGPAALLGMAVLAFTGPGGGPPAGDPGATSEGRPAGYDGGYRMFDTLPDLRGSWFWGHAVAAMRGLTCLANLAPVVDPGRLGMTGFSAGAVVTLIASGVDDRLVAGVPLSGTGAWDLATLSPNAWQHVLLTAAGLDTASPEWQALIDHLVTPAVMVGGAPTARVFLTNGTADEFFPLSATQATLAALPHEHRLSLAGNFDHGCYSLTGPEPAATIEDRASLRAAGAQRAWFRHWFGTDAVYATLPAAPAVPSLTPSSDAATCWAACGTVAPCLYVAAPVDPGTASLEVDRVWFWWSNDGGLLWGSNELVWTSGIGAWAGCFPLAFDPGVTAYYLDVQYVTPLLVRVPQERFSLSSAVTLPAGWVPAIRRQDTCWYP